ncbi:MAG: tRNA uridine-5-carboxymethylaminomethyl(34) synthesis GTPase MnmE [Akkermansia sp.]
MNTMENENNERVIASLATPIGMGALSIIRVSGADSLSVLTRCTHAGVTERLQARRVSLTDIVDQTGSPIDQVLVTWFKAPASYTGEEMVEISCHGGMLVTQRVLECLFDCGASPAEPGEFTKRAFLAGRMDLTQAEAVMDIISAGSDLALKAAREQLDGAIGHRISAWRESLIHVLAHLEAYIDFPDEEISPDTAGVLIKKLNEVMTGIERLLQTEEQGRLLREGIRTAIVGEPNVGKSSILNVLLGYERAIVSDVPGTTRDTVEETIHLGGMALRLIDTAGVRDSADSIEQAGIERTGQAIRTADLVIEVVDASLPTQKSNYLGKIKKQGATTPHILVLNKCDLPQHQDWQGIDAVRFSCTLGDGRDDLENALKSAFASHLPSLSTGDSLASINMRHRDALRCCKDSLAMTISSLKASDSPELSALELREALTNLGEITGQIDTEDILDAIFSSFCLGK